MVKAGKSESASSGARASATRKTIILIMILVIILVLVAAWGGWMALSGKWPSVVRPLQKYYQLEQVFAYPTAFPRSMTIRAVVIDVNRADEYITIVDLDAYEDCSDLSCVSFAVSVYLPTTAPKELPGSNVEVQFDGEWPSLKQIVLIKGRLLAAQNGGHLLLADRVSDSAANLLLERVR